MTNPFPINKTKIVCTIGPASQSPRTLDQMLRHGMNVARLNLAHGDAESHRRMIVELRSAAQRCNRRLAILADLPGPKLRMGRLPGDRIELARDEDVILTAEPVTANQSPARLPIDAPGLPGLLHRGNVIFLNDGFLQLRVQRIEGPDIYCRVMAGGPLSSHNGLNVPNIDLPGSILTEEDRALLKLVLEAGVDAISVSFVQSGDDLAEVRAAARQSGKNPFLIAKIERASAVRNIDRILAAADGLMVARGDLGVETPIEHIAITQKRLIQQANKAAKPVITATQMLESMVHNRRPTRAEATDVANAILDGTDCIMLSEESAIGAYPVEAVRTMARIAKATEARRRELNGTRPALLRQRAGDRDRLEDVIAVDVFMAVERLRPKVVVAPTDSGATARRLTRFRLPQWIVAFSSNEDTCQRLCFSYGVWPVPVAPAITDWKQHTQRWCHEQGLDAGVVVMTHGPSPDRPQASSFVEVFRLDP